jgi:hypothetical protein
VATRLEARVSEHDRQIAPIRKLILTGMKLLNQLAGEGVETRKELRELAAEQRATARQLESLIRSLRRGTNGHRRD